MLAAFTLALLMVAEPSSVRDTGAVPAEIVEITPWKELALDPDYGGQWVVAGDLDNDGVPEVVSAENFNNVDVHHTSACAAQRLDGTVLWRWGAPDKGRKTWHHDVACQIHDWDGDGFAEVVLTDDTAIVELDGRTGQEKRRIPIERNASDCLVFCDLSGKGRPTDIIVKNRYDQLWAHNHAGELLWTAPRPGGSRTAHQPLPVDLDNDGRDEVIAGYAVLNPDGTVRWRYESDTIALNRGHLDCARIMQRGTRPEDWRIAMTFCGANALVVADGNGGHVWEVTGHHFESINIGRIAPGLPGNQIAVDIDHQPEGSSPVWLLDGDGAKLGEVVTPYSRHHKLIDWTGDGLCELVVAGNRALYDGRGARIATFVVGQEALDAAGGAQISALTGDMDGDGVLDVLIVTPSHLFVYRNESGSKPEGVVPLGTGMNVTLY